MKVYEKYVKEKQAALSLFHSTRNRLTSLYSKLAGEHGSCQDAITRQVEQQKFLENEMAEVHNSIQQINRVVGGPNE